MFTPQINYWNDMMAKVQEMYNTSLKTNRQVQTEFTNVLKEIFQQTMKNTVGFQKETETVSVKLMDTYFENLDKLHAYQVENNDKSYQTVVTLMDTYGIHNAEFRKDIEKIWKTNGATYRAKADEMTRMIRTNQEKYLQTMFETWRNAIQEMEKVNHRVEETVTK